MKEPELRVFFSFLLTFFFSFAYQTAAEQFGYELCEWVEKEKSKRKIPHAGKAVNENNPPLGRESKENLKIVTFEGKRVSGNRVKP